VPFNEFIVSAGTTQFGTSANFIAPNKGIQNLPCITGSNTGACKSVTSTVTGSRGFLELPASVRSLSAGVLKVGDDLNKASTISGGAMTSMNNLSKNSKAIRSDLERRQKSLQKILRAGGTNIDLSKESNKFGDQLRNITKTGLKEAGMSAAEMRASIGAGPLPGGTNGEERNPYDSLKNVKFNTSNNSSTSSPAGMVSIGNGGNGGSDIPSLGDGSGKGGLTDAENAALLAAEAQARLSGKGGADKGNAGDIVHADDGPTLFEVITKRYQKSAYPRLFKKVE
jgi:hypothetical protein